VCDFRHNFSLFRYHQNRIAKNNGTDKFSTPVVYCATTAIGWRTVAPQKRFSDIDYCFSWNNKEMINHYLKKYNSLIYFTIIDNTHVSIYKFRIHFIYRKLQHAIIYALNPYPTKHPSKDSQLDLLSAYRHLDIRSISGFQPRLHTVGNTWFMRIQIKTILEIIHLQNFRFRSSSWSSTAQRMG